MLFHKASRRRASVAGIVGVGLYDGVESGFVPRVANTALAKIARWLHSRPLVSMSKSAKPRPVMRPPMVDPWAQRNDSVGFDWPSWTEDAPLHALDITDIGNAGRLVEIAQIV